MHEGKTKIADVFFNQYPAAIYKKGQILLRPGKVIKDIYYIKTGGIRQFINSPSGERLTLQIFRPGSYIPFALSLNDAHNIYFYQSIVETKVRVAPVEDVGEFIKHNHEVLLDLTTRLSGAIAGLIEEVELMVFNDAYTRVLSLLIHLGESFGEKRGEGCIITIPLPHNEIASLLGIQRETISRRMVLLKKNGVVRYEADHIVLVSLETARRELEKSRTHVP